MNIENFNGDQVKPVVFQVNTSNCGVPKLAVQASEVGDIGLEGDRQNNAQGHGGPDRAVVIYSLERILALQQEGHPIFPGAIGENLTIAGLDWSQLGPGARLRCGEQLIIEVTNYTTPCTKVSAYFRGGDFGRASQTRFPGWSRLSTRVLIPGVVQAGDRVELLS